MREAQVQEGREGIWAEETAGAKAVRGDADLAVRGGVRRSCVMGGSPSMAAVAGVEAGKQVRALASLLRTLRMPWGRGSAPGQSLTSEGHLKQWGLGSFPVGLLARTAGC